MDYIASARKLYNQTFGISEGFDDQLFNLFSHCIRYVTEGEQVVSMLFELPCALVTEKESIPACYIYAVATHPLYRGKGLATQLIDQTCAAHKLVLLRPIEESLISFYGKMGFEPYTALDKSEKEGAYILPTEKLQLLCEDDTPTEEEFCLMIKGHTPKTTSPILFAYSMP